MSGTADPPCDTHPLLTERARPIGGGGTWSQKDWGDVITAPPFDRIQLSRRAVATAPFDEFGLVLGVWMLHCHNTYHQEAATLTRLNETD